VNTTSKNVKTHPHPLCHPDPDVLNKVKEGEGSPDWILDSSPFGLRMTVLGVFWSLEFGAWDLGFKLHPHPLCHPDPEVLNKVKEGEGEGSPG
jgi:hypothetical protein